MAPSRGAWRQENDVQTTTWVAMAPPFYLALPRSPKSPASHLCSSPISCPIPARQYGHARPEPPGERTGRGGEDTAPAAVGGLCADCQQRLFGAHGALARAQAEAPMAEIGGDSCRGGGGNELAYLWV